MSGPKHDTASEAPAKALDLLFVIKSLSLRGGGAERVLTTIASALADRGHRVSIVTFDRPEGIDFYRVEANVDRRRLAISAADKRAGVVAFARRVADLRNVLRQHRPDVAIGFMHSAFVPLGMAALGLDVPVVASEHTAYVHYRRRHLERLLLRLGSPLYHMITTTSRAVGDTFPQAIARRMTVVPNPVTVASVETTPRGTSLRRRILCVGGLRPEKDQSILIDAFCQIADRFPDWDLHFVGDGPLMKTLGDQVRRLGLASRVFLDGARTDLSREYLSADIFAMPSAYESFGLATAEALAYGIPAIGFADCPGTNEVIQDGVNGVLVPAGPRAERLAEGLAGLIASPERRATLSKAGPVSMQGFATTTVVMLWENMLTEIVREADCVPRRADLKRQTPAVSAGEQARAIDRNIRVHDQIARRYERTHGEIFNDIEQPRLRAALLRALGEVKTGRTPPHVLDFGCGSGNLTSHLLACGAKVTAADVTPAFLDLVRARYATENLSFLRLNGQDLSEIADNSFDMIATYSVMHHIPDYLGACVELARVCRPGGVVMIDHESSENFWDMQPQYRQFQAAASRFDWRKYLTPINYIHRLRRVIDPRYSNEGDIHVWADDHIEWDKVRAVMAEAGCEVVIDEDYLLFRELYRREVYDSFRNRYADTKLIAFRKKA